MSEKTVGTCILLAGFSHPIVAHCPLFSADIVKRMAELLRPSERESEPKLTREIKNNEANTKLTPKAQI